MRVIFVGDSPTVSTGFSRCARSACDALHAADHEVIVLGINEKGDPNDLPYKVYPCRQPLDGGHDDYGASRLCVFIDRYRPDVVCILQDPWNIGPHFNAIDKFFKDDPETVPPVVGWLAVDSRNQLAKPLNRLAGIAVWTQFAGKELEKGGYGGPWWTVPLGVDPYFFPRDRRESRDKLAIPHGRFVVGVVGRLQTRKRLDLTLEAFHQWVTTYDVPDASIHFHVAPTNDAACNLRALAYYYGLHGNHRVYLSEPHPGVGISTELMPFTYSAYDVYLSTSQAEGWNLCAHEAMACGVPCVLPDFAGTGPDGWVGDAAIRVPCTSTALTAPAGTQLYTIGAIPDRDATVEALQALYTSPQLRADLSAEGLALASTLTWQRTGKMMVELLERIVAEDRQDGRYRRKRDVSGERKEGANGDVDAKLVPDANKQPHSRLGVSCAVPQSDVESA